MFAFTAFVAMVALGNVGENGLGTVEGNGLTQLRESARILEVEPITPISETPYTSKTNHKTIDIPDSNKSVFLRNIHSIMNQFLQNYEPTFKAHLQKNNFFSGLSIQDSMKILEKKIIEPVKIEEPENGLVQYGTIKNPKFRRNIPQITHNTPPALNHIVNGDPITSTLFCSSGSEFYDTSNQNVQVSNNPDLAPNTTLALEKAEYLQLLVPKGTIMRANINKQMSDIYGQPIYTEDQSDDTMLEIWCKVFSVREIGASF